MPMKCIAGAWRGRDVQLATTGGAPRLEAAVPTRGSVAGADTLGLEELSEPLLLDRGVQLRFGRGLAFAAVPFLVALFVWDHPVPYAALLALTVAVFLEQSVVVRYVVEFRGRGTDVALVLEMERSEWIPLVLATRGYLPAAGAPAEAERDPFEGRADTATGPDPDDRPDRSGRAGRSDPGGRDEDDTPR